MINTNELLTFLIGLGTLAFALVNRRQLKSLPEIRLLLLSFTLILLGWTVGIIEDLILKSFFNMLEHFFFGASAVVALIWCLLLRRASREAA